jgi:transcription-repair coupling factor (superfamily II helicase)
MDGTPGQLARLPDNLVQFDDFQRALATLQQGGQATFDGVVGSSCALLSVALLRQTPGPLVVVCPSQDMADDLIDDVQMFAQGRPLPFPAWESEMGERTAHDEIFGQRLRVLKRLADTRHWSAPLDAQHVLQRLIVISMQSLLQTVPPPSALANRTRRLALGERLDDEQLRSWLVQHRFHATSAVELPGEFSMRGGIIDIFAADWDGPVRVELFDDEIESIRQFDVATQRSIDTVDDIEITVLEPETDDDVPFTSHLPNGSWILQWEPSQLLSTAERYYARLESSPGVLKPAEANRLMMSFPLATASTLAEGTLGSVVRLPVETVAQFSGDVAKVRDELERVGDGQQVIIVARTEAERDRLQEIFAPTELNQSGRLQWLVGRLREGFRLVAEGTVLISGADLFQRDELRRTPRRHLGKVIDSFLDLRSGDLVVHLAHGIGRYRGLQALQKAGQFEEHLEIEFQGGTRLHVPVSKIDLVQKYVGGTKSRPRLAKLGGKTWTRQKQAAEAAVVDLAAEMLEIQAARQLQPGVPMPPDTDWQREFDLSFPYEETPDQISAVQAIKQDMQANQPMDRLLCGDVGFGKTEVAMRAAFKAVDNGYQVAVLVPTTILAEQHFVTFRQRMAEFPFDIARLSRFCSLQQQREILHGLDSGRVDIVIGTHRLASQDVQFHNLGLVIIDEEQRFGVAVKERLKSLRSSVDVITLTATPIPRTLHMSLVGVRDISNLETAPEDRVAVETRVTRFDPNLIRHAILRELNRCGQVFFVHNRVQDIENVAARLRQIVPEATIRIGHGQMPEHELEEVMVDFIAQKFDVLLATTIVESGLDIPNANTIFVDEANRYGLADLHQLRGRVGRYKHRAYCYLLVNRGGSITPNAARRLRAIEEFSDMGAGFAIAMRDLEIRGAGNLLGTQQSGHIAAVGYEHYCQLLEEAVRRLKRLPPRPTIDVDLQLPGEAFLPDDYAPDLRAKIDLYRRLTRVMSVDELATMRTELLDRFGPLPPPVERLLELAELKIDAAIWRVTALFVEDNYLVFQYADRSRIEQLARQTGGQLRIVDGQSAYLPIEKDLINSPQILQRAKSVLRSGEKAVYNPARASSSA